MSFLSETAIGAREAEDLARRIAAEIGDLARRPGASVAAMRAGERAFEIIATTEAQLLTNAARRAMDAIDLPADARPTWLAALRASAWWNAAELLFGLEEP